MLEFYEGSDFVKISEILSEENLNLKQLFFIFFNMKNESIDSQIKFSIMYKTSKYTNVNFDENLIQNNNKLMSEYTGLEFSFNKTMSTATHKCQIENDLEISRNDLLRRIYNKIQACRLKYKEYIFEKCLYTNLLAFRGSIDILGGFFTVDLNRDYENEDYYMQFTSLLLNSRSIDYLNFNFRNLQKQYIQGVKRQTQIRMDIHWYLENFLEELKLVNLYKYSVFQQNKLLILSKDYKEMRTSFIERVLIYRQEILTKDNLNLTENEKNAEILRIRNRLGFKNETDNNPTNKRNSSIKNIADIMLDDICYSCNGKYDINDRTFIKKNTNTPYLEFHHVISFASNHTADVYENLVKLCPACHRALTPNRADENYQKEIISNILINSKYVYDYLDIFPDVGQTLEDKVNFVFSNLR